jgi:predicted 2-oxoglutarate/Fe(II)-dependent dioxygenase YbiX
MFTSIYTTLATYFVAALRGPATAATWAAAAVAAATTSAGQVKETERMTDQAALQQHITKKQDQSVQAAGTNGSCLDNIFRVATVVQ